MRYRRLASFGWRRRRRSILGVRPDACALLTGLSLGAGLMYILDRDSGKRRRQLAADKLGAWTRRSTCAVEGAAIDARNRLKGIAHEASRVLRRPEPAVGIPDGRPGNGDGSASSWEGS